MVEFKFEMIRLNRYIYEIFRFCNMDKSTITKKYATDELTIVWKPGKCIHSAKCWRPPTGLMKVFNPSERPWIKPEAGTTEEIIEHVNKCPSGALSYFMNEKSGENIEEKIELETLTDEKLELNLEKSWDFSRDTKIKILINGPIMVSGSFCVIGSDGAEKVKNEQTFLCRCGASTNKPFCDGTHGKIKFLG